MSTQFAGPDQDPVRHSIRMLFMFIFTMLAASLVAGAEDSGFDSENRTTVRDLYSIADVVVHGVVRSSIPGQRPDGESGMFTVIEPLEILKGGSAGRLILHDANDVVPFQASGRPAYVAGREVVVFARSRPEGDLQTVQGLSGKFEVWKDEIGHMFAISDFWRVANEPVSVSERSVRNGVKRAIDFNSLDTPRDLAQFQTFLRNGATLASFVSSTPSGSLEPVTHAVAVSEPVDELADGLLLPPGCVFELPSYPAGQLVTSRPAQITIPRPAYLQPTSLPGLGTSLTRLTDSTVFGGNMRQYRHLYSNQQAWNSDETRLLLAFDTSPVYMLDGHTFELLGKSIPYNNRVWSETDPNVLYGTTAPNYLRKMTYISASEFVTTELARVPNWTAITIGNGEGSLSNDGRYGVLLGYTTAGEVEVKPYDFVSNVVLGTHNAGVASLVGDVDWAGMSQSGKYVIVAYNPSGPSGQYYGVYDRSMNLLRKIASYPGSSLGHVDLGYDSDGHEVLVGRQPNGEVTTYRLSDGKETVQLPATHLGGNYHVSCRNTRRPGWCYFSSHIGLPGQPEYMYDEIFALKLDGSGTIERYSPNFSSRMPFADLGYQRQAQATVNRDGTKLLFVSDWGDSSSQAVIHTYVVTAD